MLSIRSILISSCVAALVGAAAPAVQANTIETFGVVNANVGDGSNLANATIEFDVNASNDTVSITINNASTMHAANELLRSVTFGVQGGPVPTQPSNLTLTDGRSVTVASNGAASTTSLSDLSALGGNAWAITASGTNGSDGGDGCGGCGDGRGGCGGTNGTFLLSSSGPKYLVIGPEPYVDANSSIAGNPAHNAFLGNSPTFTFQVHGLAANDQINNVQVGFGTSCDVVSAMMLSPTSVPEVSTLALLMVSSTLLLVGRRRPSKA